MRVLDSPGGRYVPKFDAILVDEGQDFVPFWWNVLRRVCREKGERLLVADATQDIYETAEAWTDQVMTGAGFTGDWVRLPVSYRMPPALTDLMNNFATTYLPDQSVDAPQSPQLEFGNLYPCKLRWVQTDEDNAVNASVNELLLFAPWADPVIVAMTDITFLCPSIDLGLAVVEKMAEHKIHFLHTYNKNHQEARRLKQSFFKGAARFKATTLHSFKGWESRCIVVYIGHTNSTHALALAYTGMTRLKRHEESSFLSVVCAVEELREYGRTWPQYEAFG